MISALVLKLPNFTKEFTVETDASGGDIGAVLPLEGHPITFLSKTLSAKHQLMSTYEKEFLAVVVVLEKWRGYLLDRHFKIKTDHISLKYLIDQRMSTPTQLKWLPKLMMGLTLLLFTRRCMTREQPKQWVKWLSLAEWWYNSNFHTSTHTTPYEAVYGKPPPVHIPYIEGERKVDLVDKTLSEREEVMETLKFHISRDHSRIKSHVDKRRTDMKFDCGDWVFLKLQPHIQVSLRQRKQNKFSPKFFGPLKILQRIGKVAYKLDLPSTS
uniref:Retrotransposable element Tf2 n=1 Tax=Tanacetum cinerariifolium TaxID=118510 RepID=A0A699GSV8_TANCI|nr:retrotransposable element Tf2 [Tanacetum cinerariifolium]